MHRFTQWRDRIGVAPDIATVNAIMSEYVGMLGPLADALPSRCREALARETDVQAAAVVLLHEELRFDGSGEERALLQEIAYTFAAASMRISFLFAANATRAIGTAAAPGA